MIRTLCSALLGCLVSVGIALAQPQGPVPGQAAPVVFQTPDPQWAEKLFARLDFDFGTVARGAEAKARLKITNVYKETLHIRAAGTTCKCFTVRIPKDTLASLESTEIEITLDTLKFEGDRKSTMMVAFDAPAYAEVPIPLHAYIRRDVGLTPGAALFGTVAKGQGAQRKVQVSHVGRPDWRLVELVCKNEFLEAKATELARLPNGTTTYELLVTLKEGAPAGDFRDQITLVTDDAAGPQLPVMVEGRIEPDFFATPEILDFGVVAPGAEVTRNLVIRGKRPFKVTGIESEQTAGTFEARLPKEGKAVQVIPITLVAPMTGGPVTDEFSVLLDQSNEPVRFKAFARVDPNRQARRP
jgi:hypothetical protein